MDVEKKTKTPQGMNVSLSGYFIYRPANLKAMIIIHPGYGLPSGHVLRHIRTRAQVST